MEPSKRELLYALLEPIKRQYLDLEFQLVEKTSPKIFRVYYKPKFTRSKMLICSIKIFDKSLLVDVRRNDLLPTSVIEQIAKIVKDVFNVNEIVFNMKKY